jgi:hypothetical protein
MRAVPLNMELLVIRGYGLTGLGANLVWNKFATYSCDLSFNNADQLVFSFLILHNWTY